MNGCDAVIVEDPYIRSQHQIQNLVRFGELCLKIGTIKSISLTTGYENQEQRVEAEGRFEMLQESLRAFGIAFTWTFSETLHDREIKMSNGWIVKIGRGFDIYQPPDNWYSIGSSDFSQRPCLETKVDIYRA